jgi:hypothetical protein
MNGKARTILAAGLAAWLLAGTAAAATPGYGAPPEGLAAALARLAAAYPDVIASADMSAVVLRDGTRLPVSDGRTDKSFEEMLDHPDIDDMFAFAYPAGAEAAAPPLNFDPGRIRVEALFGKIYGDCKAGTAQKKFRKVQWLPKLGGGSLMFTTAEGADKALEQVSAELEQLPAKFRTYLMPLGGSFACRTIAGTERRSMHASGAAIDINVKHSAYWQWDGKKLRWRNEIPPEIVGVFERHGFIWGGRWYHYDTMHFEYRPEMFQK